MALSFYDISITVTSGPSLGVSTPLIHSSSTDSGGVGTTHSVGTDAPFGAFSSTRYRILVIAINFFQQQFFFSSFLFVFLLSIPFA